MGLGNRPLKKTEKFADSQLLLSRPLPGRALIWLAGALWDSNFVIKAHNYRRDGRPLIPSNDNAALSAIFPSYFLISNFIVVIGRAKITTSFRMYDASYCIVLWA